MAEAPARRSVATRLPSMRISVLPLDIPRITGTPEGPSSVRLTPAIPSSASTRCSARLCSTSSAVITVSAAAAVVERFGATPLTTEMLSVNEGAGTTSRIVPTGGSASMVTGVKISPSAPVMISRKGTAGSGLISKRPCWSARTEDDRPTTATRTFGAEIPEASRTRPLNAARCSGQRLKRMKARSPSERSRGVE